MDATLSALRRCGAVLSELHLGEDDAESVLEMAEAAFYMAGEVRVALVGLLLRCGGHLHCLPRDAGAPVLLQARDVEQSPSVRLSLLTVLAKLKTLRHLTLTTNLAPFEDLGSYSAELAAGLPLLQRLVVGIMAGGMVEPRLQALLVDLLRGAAGSLRHVNVDVITTPHPRPLLDAQAACTELRYLSVNALDLGVVLPSLPRLVELQVGLFGDVVEKVSEEEVRGQTDFLCSREPLPSLRVLELAPSLPTESLLTKCTMLVTALGMVARNVTTLKLDSMPVVMQPEDPEWVLNRHLLTKLLTILQRLRTLHLGSCVPYLVQLVHVLMEGAGALPELQEVSGEVQYVTSEEEAYAHGVIEHFKSAWPDVRADELTTEQCLPE